MLEKLQSVMAAEQARSMLNLTDDLQELEDRLSLLMSQSAGQWRGSAQESFQNALEDIRRRIIGLTGKVIQVSNKMLRVADQYERAESSGEGGGIR